ncbi:MAG: ribosome maturation factor RimP [Deltaproteobacteria bacterium]|nr:ribosome maturation factor RimP [Deltaproteobacteria bacterium]MBI4374496.1 ribosome maturation factor RimP [Deltaproteobacteria bacterium]
MQVDLEKVRGVLEPILTPIGFELVDIRFLSEQGRWVLRVLIDREGGATVGDCSRVSREVETPLEVEGLIPVPYDLEVSTPGLDRPLVKESDYRKFIGREVKIRLENPVENQRNFKGILEGIEGGSVSIQSEGRSRQLPFREIKRARLVF